jgi:hypothetical protein
MMEMRAMGLMVPVPPCPDASKTDVLLSLWTDAGLDAVDSREIVVERTFADFDDYWTTVRLGPSVGPPLAAISDAERARLEARMRDVLPADARGRITVSARAHAVKGRVR